MSSGRRVTIALRSIMTFPRGDRPTILRQADPAHLGLGYRRSPAVEDASVNR